MKKMPIALTVALALTVLSAAGARADDDRGRNAAERAADHRDLRQDRRQGADDLRDAARLDALIEQHRAAGAAHDRAALTRLYHEVEALLAVETGEAARETAQAGREVRQDRREVRGDRREIRGNQATGAGPGERRDDRHDRRDDRRDRRDDQRDAAREAERHERYVALRARWQGLDAAGDIDARLAVLTELKGMAGAELRDDGSEKREDHRELREDRRETREDRRQH